ncbi:MAG TPA: hypothetical protein VF554_11415 [Thermoanaerobaculia bacterium]
MLLRRAGTYGLLLAASLLACSRILVLPGWPDNHDGLACFQRVEIFRRAVAEGNLLPLWTPFAENGYGSPFPFFYHRLFNTLAGAVALATGSSYTAVKIVIPLLLFLGALGMRRALLAMGLGPFHAVCGALLLVFSNYAYTDWYVRGAFAEFAAFMLVPWLTLAALGVVQGKPRAGWGLGAVLSLIFFAHSIIFVFASALVFVAFLGALVLSRDWRRALLNLGQAALVVIPVTGPFLLGMWLFGKDLDLDRFRAGMFSVFRNFAPLEEYLYDRFGAWTSSTVGYSVEIGRGFNTLSLVSFAAVAAGLARRRLSAVRLREMRPAWFLVIGSAVFYFFFQLPLSAPLYRLARPLQFIQFPWRLLAFSTAASIFVLCLSLDLLEVSAPRSSAHYRLRAALLLAVLFQVYYGVGRPPTDRIFRVNDIEASLTTERLAGTVHSKEFRPRGVSLPPPRPFLEAAGCVVESASPAAALHGIVDVPELRLIVTAAPGGTLTINQFANPFLAVSAGGGGRVGTTAWAAILVQPAPGRSEIVLRRRGLLAALRDKLFRG